MVALCAAMAAPCAAWPTTAAQGDATAARWATIAAHSAIIAAYGTTIVAHWATIDKEILLARGSAIEGRQTGIAGEPYPLALGVHNQGIIGKISADHQSQA